MAFFDTNKNARIATRITRNGKRRTETRNREDGFSAAISTNSNGGSLLFLDFDGGNIAGGETIKMSGARARTLYRLLARHFDYTNKSLAPVTAVAVTSG